jgi:hypothetical protein
MVETGLRPSEIVSLTANTIHLNHPIPHVTIVPAGRILKTEESRRHIPLVGVSLAAMKLQPKGFERYHDKASSLSGIVNKYLLNHGLRPTERHTLYSLRHSFEDRLTGLGIADKLQAYLMGHKYDRPKYGSTIGPSTDRRRNSINCKSCSAGSHSGVGRRTCSDLGSHVLDRRDRQNACGVLPPGARASS